jgi:TonB family protein
MRLIVAALAAALSVTAASAAVSDDTALLAQIVAQGRGQSAMDFLAPHLADVERALGTAQPRSGGPYPRLALYAARYYHDRPADVVRVLDEGLAASDPDDPLRYDLLVLRGDAALRSLHWLEGLANFNQALAMRGLDVAQRAQALRGRGSVFVKRLAEAKADWQEVLALEPGDPEAVRTLTVIARLIETEGKAKAGPAAVVTVAPVQPLSAPPPPSPPDGIRPPRPVGTSHDCKSFYPPLSIRYSEEGSVSVRYDVADDGTVDKVTLARTSGFGRLDEAAVSCAWERWKFLPATKDGAAVAATGLYDSVRFWLPPPNAPGQFVQRGAGYREAGRPVRAIEAFDSVIALDPGDASAYQARARAWDDIGEHGRALADRAKAVSLAAPPPSP